MSTIPESGTDMTRREPFGAISQHQREQHVRDPYSGEGSSAYPSSIPAGSTVLTHVANPIPADLKRRRGRPRKYGPDGSMSMAPIPQPINLSAQQPQAFPPQAETQPPAPGGGSASPGSRKPRGRPPGSTNNRKRPAEALGSTGNGFVPIVINVKAGEDVSSKILTYSQNATKAVCVLSANGIISNITLRQPAASGGTVTYEGWFDILTLSGSFMLTERDGQRTRTGGLSATLSGPDGRVIGGCVAGLLIAAAPVQVVVGSFVVDGCRESRSPNHVESSSGGPFRANQGSGVGGPSSYPA